MSRAQSGTVLPRRSVTEKKRLLSEWEQSPLKMNDFCKEKGISLSGLKTWMRQFDMGYKRKPRKSAAARFISLIPDRSLEMSVPFAAYILPDNSKLVIHQPVAATFLRELLYSPK